jgi:hypothetical protein
MIEHRAGPWKFCKGTLEKWCTGNWIFYSKALGILHNQHRATYLGNYRNQEQNRLPAWPPVLVEPPPRSAGTGVGTWIATGADPICYEGADPVWCCGGAISRLVWQLITCSNKWISDLESRALEESSWEERWEEEGWREPYMFISGHKSKQIS